MNTETRGISKSQKRAVAIIAIALALIALALLAFSCASTVPAEDVEVNTHAGNYQVSNNSQEADITEDTDSTPVIETKDAADEETSPNHNAMPSDDDVQQASSRDSSTNHASRPSGSSSGAGTAEASAPKRWVEDTEQIWVVDRQAWSESVPVYSTTEVSICNICGSDITGDTAAHGKSHMKAGEGSGHHSEVRQSITGYNTVNHPEEGHWETRVVGGHWE